MSENPFVPAKEAAPPPEIDRPDSLLGAHVLDGPASPAAAPAAHPAGPAWERVEVPTGKDVYVMSLRGGSGGSTVADALGETATWAGYGWPVASGWTRPRPVIDVVAVCRSDRKGLDAATEFARQWGAGLLESSNLLGIVIVDDGPTLLDSQRLKVKAVARMTPHGWHVPWHEPWRITPVDETSLPRQARTARKSILKIAAKARKERNTS